MIKGAKKMDNKLIVNNNRFGKLINSKNQRLMSKSLFDINNMDFLYNNYGFIHNTIRQFGLNLLSWGVKDE